MSDKTFFERLWEVGTVSDKTFFELIECAWATLRAERDQLAGYRDAAVKRRNELTAELIAAEAEAAELQRELDALRGELAAVKAARDDLRAALEREKQAYAAELERCGLELERRQHRIKELEAQTQWEPVDDYAYTDKYDVTVVSYGQGRAICVNESDGVLLPDTVRLCRRVDAAPDAAKDGAQ